MSKIRPLPPIRGTGRSRRAVALTIAPTLALLASGAAAVAPASAAGPADVGQHSLRAASTDENFYFVMADRFANGSTANDRGGLTGDRMTTGFDPSDKAFYEGGDLAGLHQRLDYVQGLGTTAIWLTPSFKNKPVQPEDGSAGYHGYWVTDFTQIDPHLGTNAELKALIDDAHARGMKVYFDIITNHTADVIGYEHNGTRSQRLPYVSKDAAPYTDATGASFDDRDFAGGSTFPALDPAASFPYRPVVADKDKDLKVPSWLNDPTLYHNRGDTTFTGEDSLYGDFFGLDDLFTENPRVVDGFTDVYQTWIGDFGVDGFRIDTMRHVDDEFWKKFGPRVLDYARAHGKPDFYMFGEVADSDRPRTSHFTTRDKMQGVLDFPFQDAARGYASKGAAASSLSTFFAADDWYTDADSNAYQLPTFLGNHDMGRIGHFLQQDNPGASEAELLQRDRLAHELMYFSRGNPVVYYGDEQGFTGSGGDQLARQSMFASSVPQYLDDDLLGTSATHERDNFSTTHPLYTQIAGLATVVKDNPALRDGLMQPRFAADGPGIFAFSRLDVDEQVEYVVATNNSTAAARARVGTYAGNRQLTRLYGDGPATLRTAADRSVEIDVAPLSTVVYKMDRRIPTAAKAPAVRLETPAISAQDNARMQVAARVSGSSVYEVTFQAKVAGGTWQNIGTDDNAPYQVFHDVSALRRNATVQYRAVVLDNAGRSTLSASHRTQVPAAKVALTTPTPDAKVRGKVTVQAVVDPEKASNVVRLQRRLAGDVWRTIGTDSSSPVYTATDDLSAVTAPTGSAVEYRAQLMNGTGVVATSAVASTSLAGPALTTTTVSYYRPGGDYGDWGLHLWGDGIDPALLSTVDWQRPMSPTRITPDGWAQFDIPLVSDTSRVNFIVHTPGGDTVPTTREPGGDRSYAPVDSAEIWLVAGDPTVYTTRP